MSKSYTIDEVKQFIDEQGHGEYKLLSTEYINVFSKLTVLHTICNHKYQVTFHMFRRGNRCPFCSGCHRYNIDEVRKIIDEQGNGEYKLLSTEYKNTKEKLTLLHTICNHKYQVTFHMFRRGNRCPFCCVNHKYSIAEIKKIIDEKGNGEYKLLSTKYSNANDKITLLHTVCNHIYQVRFSSFTSAGIRCSYCSGHHRRSFDEVKQFINEKGNGEYKLLSKEYHFDKKITLLHIICNHRYSVLFHSFARGARCPFCRSSHGETYIAQYLTRNNIEFVSQKKFDDCYYIRSLPFDFYLPNRNICIEFDGIQHFQPVKFFRGQEGFEMRKKLDNIKNKYCHDNHIKLIRIRYDESINNVLDKELKI